MRFIIDFIYLLIAGIIAPVIVYRMIRHKRYRLGWSNRFGHVIRRDPALKKCIWLHAVSVGEVNATRTIVQELENRFPDFEIIISTTTDTGFARATNVFGADYKVIFFPLDLSWIMNRAFREIQPAVCLLMELEVWPNFVQIAAQLRIPVIVVNGRISDRSFSKYQTIKPIAEKMFQKLSLILAQTDEYARRFVEIGCFRKRVIVTGSLKYDTAQITDKIKGADIIARQLNIGSEKLWVAGGTGNDEERLLLDVYQNLRQQNEFSDLRFVIVPRKPERFDEVAQLIEQSGFELIRYSQVKEGGIVSKDDKQAVILGDTMGDLRKFYSLATIIFVGRSLVPMGGSDMLEAAALGKTVLFGPYAFNFKHTVDVLLEGDGAIMVENQLDLFDAMQKCLSEPRFARQIARNGREVIKNNQGATQKTITQIAKFLKSS